ncbi:hypothetical protein PQX77_004526 [Marasmius sp. AFHP31]|nr:hypothetical protein PQX77_004526 [Marasmius sp. AFHP31]
MVETRGQTRRAESAAQLVQAQSESGTAAPSALDGSPIPPASGTPGTSSPEPDPPNNQAGGSTEASFFSHSPLTSYDYDASVFKDIPLHDPEGNPPDVPRSSPGNVSPGKISGQPSLNKIAVKSSDDGGFHEEVGSLMRLAQDRVKHNAGNFQQNIRLNKSGAMKGKSFGYRPPVQWQRRDAGVVIVSLVPAFLADLTRLVPSPCLKDENGDIYPIPPENLQQMMELFEIRGPFCWCNVEVELFVPVNVESAAYGCHSFKCSKSSGGCGYFVTLPWLVSPSTSRALVRGIYENKGEDGVRGIRRYVFEHGSPPSPSSTPSRRSHTSGVFSRDSTPFLTSTPSRSHAAPSLVQLTPPPRLPSSHVKLESMSHKGKGIRGKPKTVVDQFRARKLIQKSSAEDKRAAKLGLSSSSAPPPSTQPRSVDKMETIDLTNLTDSEDSDGGALHKGTKRLWDPRSSSSPRPIKRINRGPQEKTLLISDRFENYMQDLPALGTNEGMDLQEFNTFVNSVVRCKHCQHAFFLEVWEEHDCPERPANKRSGLGGSKDGKGKGKAS